MFGKAKKQKTKKEKHKKVKERGLTLFKLNLPPIVFVVLVVLVCGYISYLQYASLEQEAEQVQHVAGAEKVAAQLGGRLIALGDAVAMQAKADEGLLAALVSDDEAAIREYEAGLAMHFPEAMRIRVIRPGDTQPDSSITPPISYACLDLARQAEGGKARPPIEEHLHGSEGAHLDLVRPITEGNMVVASLMVSYKPTKVKEWLKELSLNGAYVELKQGWEGPSLGSLGNRTFKVGEPMHRAMVPASSWEVSYWAESAGMANAKTIGFLLTFAIAAGIVAVVMFFYGLFTAAIIKRELNGMAEFVVESRRGKRFHSYPVKMAEMERALHMMEPALGVSLQNEGNGSVQSDEEEVPDMMFMDFGEITVEEESAQGDEDKPKS